MFKCSELYLQEQEQLQHHYSLIQLRNPKLPQPVNRSRATKGFIRRSWKETRQGGNLMYLFISTAK